MNVVSMLLKNMHESELTRINGVVGDGKDPLIEGDYSWWGIASIMGK